MLCLGGSDDMLRVSEVAQRCKVDRGKIYRFINQNGIKPVQIDNGVSLYDDSIVELFKQFEQNKHIKIKDNANGCLDKKQSEQDFNLEKIKILEVENDFLKKQLVEQNSQIKELHTLLHEANQNYLALGRDIDLKENLKDKQVKDNGNAVRSVRTKNEQCKQGEQKKVVRNKESEVGNENIFKKILRKLKENY